MGWKYIMFEIEGKETTWQFPIIFPDKLIHQHVAMHIKPMLMADFPTFKIKVVNAGSVGILDINSVFGESETLGLKSKPEDTDVINTFEYMHGIK